MQAKARQVHVRWRRRRVEPGQDVAQLFHVLAEYAARVVILVKAFETFVAYREDHAVSVMRNVTPVKRGTELR